MQIAVTTIWIFLDSFCPKKTGQRGRTTVLPKASGPLDITRHSALDNQKYQLICPSVQIMKRLKNRPLFMRPQHGRNCDDFLSHGKNHLKFPWLKVQLLGQKSGETYVLKWVVYISSVSPTFPTFSQGFLHLRRLIGISFIERTRGGHYSSTNGKHLSTKSKGGTSGSEVASNVNGLYPFMARTHENPRRSMVHFTALSRPWEIMTKTDIWGSLVAECSAVSFWTSLISHWSLHILTVFQVTRVPCNSSLCSLHMTLQRIILWQVLVSPQWDLRIQRQNVASP